MANEVILTLNFDTEKSVQNVEKLEGNTKSLFSQIRNYKKEAAAAGVESPIGQEAIKKAAQLQGELDKINELVKRNNTDFDKFREVVSIGKGAINSYAAFQSVSALVGVENEKLLETMVKLQAAQQLLNSLEAARASLLQKNSLITKGLALVQKGYTVAVGTTTGAMKALRLATMALGLGLIIGLITGIIKIFQKWGDTIMGIIDSAIAPFRAALEWLGLVDSKETKEAIKRAEEREAAIWREVDAIEGKKKATADFYDFEKRKAQASGATQEELLELDKQRLKSLMALAMAQNEQMRATIASGKATQEQIKIWNANQDAIIGLRKDLEILAITEKKQADDALKKQQEADAKALDQRKAAWLKRNEELKKQREAELKEELRQAQLLQDLRIQLIEDETERTIQALQVKFARQMEAEKGNADIVAALVLQREKEIAAIREAEAEKIQTERLERERVNELSALEAKLINVRNDFMLELELKQQLYDLEREQLLANEALTAGEREKIEADYNKKTFDLNEARVANEKAASDAIKAAKMAVVDSAINAVGALAQLAGEQTKIGKALALAQIAADTGRAIGSLVAASNANPANAATAGAAGAAQFITGFAQITSAIAQAKRVLGAGGGGISAPSVSNTTVATRGEGQGQGNNRETVTTDPSTLINGGGKVSVLESDIQRATNRNRLSVAASEI
jgi:hypothetical protein